MNLKKNHYSRRALALLLTLVMCVGMIPTAFAAQQNSYHDPAEHWMQASGRTNELDANSVVTRETFKCGECGKATSFEVFRVPEYTRNGQPALSRNVKYSDGTMVDGVGKGDTMDGIPGKDATYTGYHYTKAVCETCGGINTNMSKSEYGYLKNVYWLYDCAAAFTQELDETVSYEYTDDTYHTVTTKGGTYCAFCYGTNHTVSRKLERHSMVTEVLPQPANGRFATVEKCSLCDYTRYDYTAAKAVVASYYGVVDGQPHTISVTDLSEAGVRTSIRYGNSADSCTMTSAPNYTDEGQYEAIYEPGKEERYYHDATKIDPADLPDFDLLCGGFPCQTFSIAGRRKGFDDTRGTLFFEIARLAQSKRPSYLLLENVPGLLSHDKGRTFSVILATLNDLGYRVEWMVLNSKHFGVPQSRRRLFLICYLDPRCAGKIFPVFGTGGKALIQVLGGSQGSRVYDADGIACTQTAGAGGVGGKTGLYIIPQDRPFVDLCAGEARQTEAARCLTARYGQTTLSNHRAERSGVLLIKEATKKGYKEANPGDSVDLGFSGSNTRRGRVGQDIAHTLETSCIQGIVERGGRIRRLMPRECLRLQGFDEWQIARILAIQSDAQAYKQAGNSVTANVIEAIGHRIREVDAELKAGAAA